MPKLPILRGLLDTSVFIAIEHGREVDYGALPLEQFVSSITRGELIAGLHAATTAEVRTVRLSTIEALAGFTTLAADAAAATQWGRLRHAVASKGLRPQVNDLWIASIALAHGLPVVTQDDDFLILSDLGGPDVILV